jgi:hypothetical protein
VALLNSIAWRSGLLPAMALACLVIGVPGSHADEPPEDGFVGPAQMEPLNIIIPLQIQHLVPRTAVAEVIIRLDESGKVVDSVCLHLPHHLLVEPIKRALGQIQFRPAMLDGEPVAVDLRAEIPVGEIGYYGILTITPATYIEGRFADISQYPNQLTLCPASELDRPLQILHRGAPVRYIDEEGNLVAGRVRVDFYVDSEGVPRMLRTPEEAPLALRDAAHHTVGNIRFVPPTCRHNPTVVKASIEVQF